jgi:hypothetical protein
MGTSVPATLMAEHYFKKKSSDAPFCGVQKCADRRDASSQMKRLIYDRINNTSIILVPKKGLEPPHPCEYVDLNHARLPIPPLRHLMMLRRGSAERAATLSLANALCSVKFRMRTWAGNLRPGHCIRFAPTPALRPARSQCCSRTASKSGSLPSRPRRPCRKLLSSRPERSPMCSAQFS